jgi:hypothetical protein
MTRSRSSGPPPSSDTPAVSSLETRTTTLAKHLHSLDARKKSGIAFVSWERSLSQTRENEAACIDYPLDPPPGFETFLTDDTRLADAARNAIRRLLSSRLPDLLGLSKNAFAERCAEAAWHLPAHDGYRELFIRWDADEVTLYAAANIRLAKGIVSCKHAVPLGDPEIVFTGGAYAPSAHPRLVAWRTWIDFAAGTVDRYDQLMDLRSFAWYALQQHVASDHVILPGSYLKEGRTRPVLAAKRSGGMWMVDRWDEYSAPVPIMSVGEPRTPEK